MRSGNMYAVEDPARPPDLWTGVERRLLAWVVTGESQCCHKHCETACEGDDLCSTRLHSRSSFDCRIASCTEHLSITLPRTPQDRRSPMACYRGDLRSRLSAGSGDPRRAR